MGLLATKIGSKRQIVLPYPQKIVATDMAKIF